MTQRVVNYTYGTGNPVLPDGSIDVRDGINNLQSFDVFMNADEDTYNQRDGGIVKTISGAIKSTGFKPGSGDFTTGFTVIPGERDIAWYDPVSKNWYSYLGVIPTSGHQVVSGTNPVGDVNWAPRTDESLRHELAAGSGSSLIGFSQPNSTTTRTLEDKVSEKISISDFGPVDFTGVIDASPIARKAINYAITRTDVSGTDNAESKSVTINMGRGIIRIDSTVLVPRNVVITSDGVSIVSSSNDPVFESAYMLNSVLTSNFQLSDADAITNRLVGTKLENLTFYQCAKAINMRAFNEQCGLQRLRFYQCGTAYAVYQSFYSNYKDIIIRQVKPGLDNLPAVIYGRASNRISTDELYIVGRNKGIRFGEPGAFGQYGSSSCQFTGLSLETLNEGFEFVGQVRNIKITGTYVEHVSSVFFDTDGDVKHEVVIEDGYSYSSAFYVDLSGLRDSFIGGVTDAHDPVNKAAVRLRQGSLGNTATVEVYGLDNGTTGNNRYQLSEGVRTTGVLTKYTGGQYAVLKSQDFAEYPETSVYAKQVPVHDIGWYGTAQNYVIGTVSGGVSNTQDTEMYALTNFLYSEYTSVNYSIVITPNIGSGAGGTTPSPILIKGIAIGGHATQIVPNGISVFSSRDNTTGTVRLNFGQFGSSLSDPEFAWMRNGLFKSEGIIKLIA